MGNYSINDIEKLSGIKAHTIRIWEKRYGIIEPKRTDTNIRFYDDNDLKRILNIAFLNRNGIKISKIAKSSEDEIATKVAEYASSGSLEPNQLIDSLIVSMIDLDEEKFHKTLQVLESRFGFEETMVDVIYPFLTKVGLLWQIGTITPAQEHFMSNLIRQKLIAAIDKIPHDNIQQEEVHLLFLREGELHELGLLFYTFILKSAGKKVVYLGQSVPYEDLKVVASIHKPNVIITSFVSYFSIEELREYIERLSSDFNEAQIIITGHFLVQNELNLPDQVYHCQHITELKALLDIE